MDRREILLEGLDLGSRIGLEIGPLANPIVRKQDGRIIYVDYADTKTLRERYKNDPNINIRSIVEVDAVWGGDTLQDAIGASNKVDYVVASHVIEHVPDLITWLNEIQDVLTTNGEVRLAIPDRRYTFDYLRSETSLADVVCANLTKARVPQPHEIIDFIVYKTQIDTGAAWRDEIDEGALPRDFTFEAAIWLANDAVTNGTYHDVHCWVFTPHSFAKLMKELSDAGLIKLSCKSFRDTPTNEIEFYISLVHCEDNEKRASSWQSVLDRACPPGALNRINLKEKEGENASKEQQIQHLTELLESKNQVIGKSIHELANSSKRIAILERQLALSMAAESAYKSSTSWRITAPVRRIGTLLKYCRRRSNR